MLELQYDWCLTLRITYTEGDDAMDTLSGSVARIRDDIRLMVLSDPKISRT